MVCARVCAALQVCVGATCPEDRLHLLLPLLDPEGGKLLAPIDNDLRLYTRGADGKLRQRVVSSVRFSDLEVRGAAVPWVVGGVGAAVRDRGQRGSHSSFKVGGAPSD